MPRLTRSSGAAAEVAEEQATAEAEAEAEVEAEAEPEPEPDLEVPIEAEAPPPLAQDAGISDAVAEQEAVSAVTEWAGEAAAAAAIAEAENTIIPTDHDVLAGRGASVNVHKGNQHFRTLCFQRKPEFDKGNHADKRRVATEIVDMIKSLEPPGRFLKRQWDVTPKQAAVAAEAGGDQRSGKGPWVEISHEKAIQKACQVMRDHHRADRMAPPAEADDGGSAKKKRKTGTGEAEDAFTEQMRRQQEQMIVAVASEDQNAPNPIYAEGCTNGVVPTDNDVLSGRGAFVNAHPGNRYFRTLAVERKEAFDRGNYADKRTLAAEVVRMIKDLTPPGRFLKRIEAPPKAKNPAEKAFYLPPRGFQGPWEELSDEKCVHKACQVMRDLRRPDRMGDNPANAPLPEGSSEAAAAAAALEGLAPVAIPEAAPEDVSEEPSSVLETVQV